MTSETGDPQKGHNSHRMHLSDGATAEQHDLLNAHEAACSYQQPPELRSRRTVKLLAARPDEPKVVGLVSGRALRRTSGRGIKPCMREYRCVPSKANDEFVTAMEDVPGHWKRDFSGNGLLAVVDGASRQQSEESRVR